MFWKKEDDLSIDKSMPKDPDLGKQDNTSFSDNSSDRLGLRKDSELGLRSDNQGMRDSEENSSSASTGLRGSGHMQENMQNLHSQTGDLLNDQGKDSLSDQQQYDNQIKSSQSQNINSQNKDKDLEIISLKLDMIKASIDTINQRLANIEHIAKESQERY